MVKTEHIISTLDDKKSTIHNCAQYGFVRYIHLIQSSLLKACTMLFGI